MTATLVWTGDPPSGEVVLDRRLHETARLEGLSARPQGLSGISAGRHAPVLAEHLYRGREGPALDPYEDPLHPQRGEQGRDDG